METKQHKVTALENIEMNELDSMLINYIPKRYLNQREACRYAGTSPKTMNEWIKRGLKQIVFDDSSNPKYDIKDIDEFMCNHKIGG
ncbi:DNA-binding protein [Enterococcus faecalis]